MRFKKWAASVLCGAAMFTSSICFATVDDEAIALGDLHPGMSVNDLVYSFGQPNGKDGSKWIYDNFHAVVKHNIVQRISTHSEDFVTPIGSVCCGMSEDVLKDRYGEEDDYDYSHEQKESEYTYLSHDGSKKIVFRISRGVIIKIVCELRD